MVEAGKVLTCLPQRKRFAIGTRISVNGVAVITPRLVLALLACLVLCAMATAQNSCGDTLNWTSTTCQVIGSGSLSSAMVNGVNDPNAWTVISRHGEYGQSETECNVPSAITQAGSELTITT